MTRTYAESTKQKPAAKESTPSIFAPVQRAIQSAPPQPVQRTEDVEQVAAEDPVGLESPGSFGYSIGTLSLGASAAPAIRAIQAKRIAGRLPTRDLHPGLRTTQLEAEPAPNRTGMPNTLKAGVESLSGMSLDHVKVHYNSDKPSQLGALAYAQGSEIHVSPGQERHLPHEAWHVVQQAQGRVKPTMQMKDGVAVNDDTGLEHEADVMGARATGYSPKEVAADTVGRDESALCFPYTQIKEDVLVNDDAGLEHEADVMGNKALQTTLKYKQGCVVAQKMNIEGQGSELVSHRTEGRSVLIDRRVSQAGDVSQMKTDIKHTAANITWEGATGLVGKKMEAKLDPTDPVKGSKTDASEKTALDAKVAEYNKGMWARGHLLNHDLGGYGVPDNLYPISPGANAHHAQTVEYPVKKALTKAKNNRDSGNVAGGVNIFYKLEVKGTPSQSQFHCNWYYANSDFDPVQPANTNIKIIESKLNDSTRSDIKEPFFSARGQPNSLRDWHHGNRSGMMTGDRGFKEDERVSSETDLAGVSAIDPNDRPTPKYLSKEQKEEINKASKAHTLAVRYEKKLSKACKEATEITEEIVGNEVLAAANRRKTRSAFKKALLDPETLLKIRRESQIKEVEIRNSYRRDYQLAQKRCSEESQDPGQA